MADKKGLKEKISVLASRLAQIAEGGHAKKPDFRESVQWRIFRIMAEFVDGFEFLSEFKKSVTIFGSLRVKAQNLHYKRARKLAKILAKEGFTVVTGGGSGIMEAANRGASESSGDSVGLNIQLKHKEQANKYVTKAIGFHYFFTRKVMLSYAAQAYVFFPGGFGTLDELLEILTLVQTKKIPEYIPVICIGKKYWTPLFDWIEKTGYYKHGYIDKADMSLYNVVDTVDEAFEIIAKSKIREDVYY